MKAPQRSRATGSLPVGSRSIGSRPIGSLPIESTRNGSRALAARSPGPNARAALFLAATATGLLGCGGDGPTWPGEQPPGWAGATPGAPGSPAPGSDPAPFDSSDSRRGPPSAGEAAPPADSGSITEGNPDVSGSVDDSGEGSEPQRSTPAQGEGAATEDPEAPDPAGAAPEAQPGSCVIPAPLTAPVGYGSATTGAGSAPVVVVRSFAEAEAALAEYRKAFKERAASALSLRYEGTFDFSSITDVCEQREKKPQRLEIKEMENVTLLGAPGSSANFGVHINRAQNVIVRNMTLGLLPGGGDSDAITIEGNGTNGDVQHVWIDHNELFSSTKSDCEGAGDTEFDGLIDIKKGARFITISYNHLHDHQKTGLLGFSDSDEADRYVTFHHNRYENVVSRTPLLRFGYVHLLNNYFGNIRSSGINVRMGGVALIEANFFENAANPITSRYSPEPGYWDLRDNHVGAGITWSAGDDTLANADDWQSTIAFPEEELTYSYEADEGACVKQIVLATAGANL